MGGAQRGRWSCGDYGGGKCPIGRAGHGAGAGHGALRSLDGRCPVRWQRVPNEIAPLQVPVGGTGDRRGTHGGASRVGRARTANPLIRGGRELVMLAGIRRESFQGTSGKMSRHDHRQCCLTRTRGGAHRRAGSRSGHGDPSFAINSSEVPTHVSKIRMEGGPGAPGLGEREGAAGVIRDASPLAANATVPVLPEGLPPPRACTPVPRA